jgi:putative ABC transport system substrate-binding protein
MIKRREFITLLGGAAVTWPLAVRAQQPRQIGMLLTVQESDPATQDSIAVFQRRLRELGWVEDRTIRFERRYAGGDPQRMSANIAEIVGLRPDVILAQNTPMVAALRRQTDSIPIVFVQVSDPVGAGFVETLPRPGGNATGFMLYEYFGTKWLELLKEIAPGVKRVAFLQTSGALAGPGQFGAMQGSAPSLGVEVRPIRIGDAGEFERVITAFAHSSDGGLIVGAGTVGLGALRHGVIELAARHRLPAIYSDLVFATEGGLLAYAPDRVDQYRRAVGYVDRILKGEKPADLPVQAPTKYELVINLKTARALGLEVPPTLLALADEVIE